MENKKVKYLLIVTLVVMTVIPVIATTFFLDQSLETTLNLGFNNSVNRVLSDGAENLKRLKNLDPDNEAHYRSQFTQIQSLRQVYENAGFVKSKIKDSLKVYFWLGLASALALSLIVALYLSRKINSSYQLVFSHLIREKEKVSYLEEISSWQELAKMLAHEIKNPLTPIELLVGSLSKSYELKTSEAFAQQLENTQAMVSEELNHLKSVVDRFSEFSRLPQVELEPTDMVDAIQSLKDPLASFFIDARIRIESASHRVMVALDKPLFRQVLVNLIKNGVEANPHELVEFCIQVKRDVEGSGVVIEVSNSGKPIPPAVAKRIFDPYVSTKSGKANMGLGLTIAKKIIVEHGGSITYFEEDERPVFVIFLPEVDS